MLNRKKYFFFVLNFFIGTIFLTILFHYVLSLSVQKSLLFAGILSFVFDLAYIFEKVSIDYYYNRQEKFQFFKFTRGEKFVLILLFSFGFIYGALAIHYTISHYTISIPLVESFIIASIIIISIALHIVYIRKKNDRKPIEKVIYSWKNFFMELLSFLFVFTTAHFSGVRLEKSIAMALYIFILFTLYYSQLPHKYVIPHRILRIRLIVIFIGITSGLHMFVIDSIILSGLIGAFFTAITEKNYKITEKLISEGILEEKFMEKRAWIIFYSISYGYGAAIGVMFASKIYSASFFGEWLLVMFRLLYIFTVIFIPLGTLIGWARMKLYEREKREK